MSTTQTLGLIDLAFQAGGVLVPVHGGTGNTIGTGVGVAVACVAGGGADIPYGSVVSLSANTAGASTIAPVVVTASSNARVFGVVIEEQGIASSSNGLVLIEGVHPYIRIVGGANRGDFLFSSPTAGLAYASPLFGDNAFGVVIGAVGSNAAPARISAPLQGGAHRSLAGGAGIRRHTDLIEGAALTAPNGLSGAGGPISNVNDGDDTTSVVLDAAPRILRADIGRPVVAAAWRLRVGRNSGPNPGGTLTLEGSANDLNWTVLDTRVVTIPNEATPLDDVWTFPTPQPYRYYRVTVGDGGTTDRVFEWQVYEETPGYLYGVAESSSSSNANLGTTIRRLDTYVSALTASASNTLRGTVDLRAGTNIALGVASNTITIIGTGGSGAHAILSANHTGFPGGTTTFLRADGVFAELSSSGLLHNIEALGDLLRGLPEL